ncbi:hypothetical protein KAI87_10725 [Myxococcota bacterium]|nr:hypothetical protein [Myxococcota bacterium]
MKLKTQSLFFATLLGLILAACGSSTVSGGIGSAAEGDACDKDSSCMSGLLCTYETCHKICTTNTECEQLSQHCDTDLGVCMKGGSVVCGNGVIDTTENCDDENTLDNDGCSSICQQESRWLCKGTPSVCTPCGDTDPEHCGNSCMTCLGTTPICSGGTCICNETSCDNGSYCNGTVCTPCTDTDPLHCGSECSVCQGTTPTCSGGSCDCSEGSCTDGTYCDPSTIKCAGCTDNDPLHCGSECLVCSGTTSICNEGSCECTTGSCSAGDFCNNGSCMPCTCPSLFPACQDIGDNSFQCECTSSSCLTQSGIAGICRDENSSCTFFDDFETPSSLLSPCPLPPNGISSWEYGEAKAETLCYGDTGKCWGTVLNSVYENCESSCIQTPKIDLKGVQGSVQISFMSWYQMEEGYDGVTPLFWDGSNFSVINPIDGWDTDFIMIGSRCETTCADQPDYACHIPCFGNYDPPPPPIWLPKEFLVETPNNAAFFNSDFSMNVLMQSDTLINDFGFYLDDLQIRVIHN